MHIEIPWGDDNAWGEIDFSWTREDPDTGMLPEGTVRLWDIADGEHFEDAEGRDFVKAADGPVQGACVVIGLPANGVAPIDGTWAQLDGNTIVHHG